MQIHRGARRSNSSSREIWRFGAGGWRTQESDGHDGRSDANCMHIQITPKDSEDQQGQLEF